MHDALLHCPECGKPLAVPTAPTAACAHCGAELDLSAFLPRAGPRAAAVAPPVVQARPVPVAVAPRADDAPAAGVPAPHGHHHARAPSSHHGRGARAQQATTVLLVTLGVAALVGVAVLIGQRTTDDQSLSTAAEGILASVREREAREGAIPGARPSWDGAPAPPSATPPAPAGGPPSARPDAPARLSPEPGEAPKPKTPSRKEVEVKTYPYPPDVSAEDQNRIEDRVRTALEVGGREGREAETQLAALGLKAAPRLIGEFKNVLDRHGLEKPEGLMRAMVLDRVLRRIDGVQERLFGDPRPIHVNSDPKEALRTVKNWNWWWDTREYEKHPRAPWDPAVDEKDAASDEGPR